MPGRTKFISLLVVSLCSIMAHAQDRQAPPGMFKELDDETAGKALLIHGKQLFIDDYVIEELTRATKTLHQPVKHPKNPLIRRDRGWEKDLSSPFGYGAVVRDERDGLYKIWYQVWHDDKDAVGSLGYVTSPDGIAWDKPITDKQAGNNFAIFESKEPWVAGAGVIIDNAEKDLSRRFKMLYLAKPTGKSNSLQSCVAYSADGVHWNAEPKNPLIPYSDTQIAPYWDARLNRYVAYLRFGPPNVRIISRIESADFLHWSPKVTVIKKGQLDAPFATELYTMGAMPYEGIYIGILNTYHGETIKPIPEDKPWMDRVNNQLAFSRNGVAWQRVLKNGAISAVDLRGQRDWKQSAEEATFLSYGEFKKDWDWGQIYPHHPPLVVGDEIRFYYTGITGRHWHTYHHDARDSGIGLATLRLDGFVSVNGGEAPGAMTTKPLVFLGDTLVVNADASGGSLTAEALDAQGNVIAGFAASDCSPITTDSVRHVLTWKDNPDCHLLQGRPIKLRFHLKNARLYSFEPEIRHNHYLQSYD
jgi:hypothetical protein